MGLLADWRHYAYEEMNDNTQQGKKFWVNYFGFEQGVYKQLLANPDEVVKGTVKELADKFGTSVMIMTGFIDGIEESLQSNIDLEAMEEDTEITLDIDLEMLYRNMVECDADWLYNLEEWEPLITKERRAELYKIQKSSKTVVKPPKIGRNDPCPCGSGRKYKQCCGRN